MTAPEWKRLGWGVVLGAVVAYPAGVAFSGLQVASQASLEPRPLTDQHKVTGRNVYSPDILSDPYVLREQEKIVEKLELSCRQTGDLCAESEQARQALYKTQALARRRK